MQHQHQHQHQQHSPRYRVSNPSNAPAAHVIPCHTGILPTDVSFLLSLVSSTTSTRLTPSQNRLPRASGELLLLRRAAMVVTTVTTRDHHRPHIRHTLLKATLHIHPTASPHLIRATVRRLLGPHHLSSMARLHRLQAAHMPTTISSLPHQGHRQASTEEPRPNMGRLRRLVSQRRFPQATAHRRASSGTQGRPPTR